MIARLTSRADQALGRARALLKWAARSATNALAATVEVGVDLHTRSSRARLQPWVNCCRAPRLYWLICSSRQQQGLKQIRGRPHSALHGAQRGKNRAGARQRSAANPQPCLMRRAPTSQAALQVHLASSVRTRL